MITTAGVRTVGITCLLLSQTDREWHNRKDCGTPGATLTHLDDALEGSGYVREVGDAAADDERAPAAVCAGRGHVQHRLCVCIRLLLGWQQSITDCYMDNCKVNALPFQDVWRICRPRIIFPEGGGL